MTYQANSTARWLFTALLLGASAMLSYEGFAGTMQPPIPPGAQLGSWYDNGHGGRYVLQVIEGQIPAAGWRVAGVVKSDTDCEPDAQGLNHCHNAIELSNGRRITVIDTHQMMRNRCLAPGDRISLSAIGPSWLVGTLSGKP